MMYFGHMLEARNITEHLIRLNATDARMYLRKLLIYIYIYIYIYIVRVDCFVSGCIRKRFHRPRARDGGDETDRTTHQHHQPARLLYAEW